MATLASEIMDRARTVILDKTSVRWPLAELCLWVNDAQREIAVLKPAALAKNVAIALQEGTLQALPSDFLGLIRVVRNLSSPADAVPRIGSRPISVVSSDILDAQAPDWHDPVLTPYRKQARHYLYDEQDPLHFYVYPGNDGTGVVEAVLVGNPKKIAPAVGADPGKLDSYAIPLEVADTYANAVTDYVLYRAYSKDANFAGNAQRAAAHYQLFVGSVGATTNQDMANSPNAPSGTKVN